VADLNSEVKEEQLEVAASHSWSCWKRISRRYCADKATITTTSS